MSNTKKANSININKINEIDKKQWNILLTIMSSPRCESSLEDKIINFIESSFNLFPKAKDYFIMRINNIINIQDKETLLLMIFRDIIDFQVQASLVEPLIKELKRMNIISYTIPDKTFKDVFIDYSKSLVKIEDFVKVFKIPTSISENTYTPAELHITIIARYYSALSTVELKELIYDLTGLIKNKEDKIDKFPKILPIEIPHVVIKSSISVTTQKEREKSINRLKIERSDLSKINKQSGGVENYNPTSPKIKINGNILDKYNNFVLNTQYILDPEIERRARIKAGLRIIGTSVIALLGLFCSVGTIIPVIGTVAVVTCPTLKIGTQLISIFIDTSLSQDTKKLENNIDDKELLLFTLAKNSNIAWRLEDCPKRKIDKKSCNVLLKDEDGYERTWYEFIIDILAGTMTTHNIYNLCFVTMSAEICINTTHIELVHNYDMLGNDINYIIKNINKRESSVINYIKKKNYNVNYVTSELSIYMDKCFYNAECIDESKSLLDKIGSNLVIEHLIEEIFNKIKNKIVSLNKKHKTNISDDNLKSAIKCLINFVLNPSKIFPLKDKTSISGDVTIYNLDYNTYLWGRLEQKCTFDSNNDEIISKLKKASVIENIKLLEKFKGLNADDAKLKVYPDDKKTLLHIAIEAFVDTFKNKFNFNPPIFDFDFENSGSDYKETTQTFNANSLGIESPKDTISISEVCGKLFPDNVFKADGKLTDECVAEIAKYVDDKCSSSLSPSRQISEINLNLENSQKCKKIILDKRSLNSTCGTKPVFETVDCRLRKITKFDKDQRIKTIRAKLPNLIRSSTISSNSINRLPPPVINLSTISAPVSQTGGKKKINILGRERRIINKNNKDYIRYKNELITLKEANKLNKLKNI